LNNVGSKRLEFGAPLEFLFSGQFTILDHPFDRASLSCLFFDYLGQGFELGAKPIKMFFVPFRLSKQLH